MSFPMFHRRGLCWRSICRWALAASGSAESFRSEADSGYLNAVAELAHYFGVPVLLHFEYGTYNLGFERFYKVLERFPQVDFIGHAQTWWLNIDKNADPMVLYPKGPVTPGGLTDRWLSDYHNMYGDLSAGSGLNALLRDEDHARAFLARHQDKLLYGSDCSDRVGSGPKCSGSQQLALRCSVSLPIHRRRRENAVPQRLAAAENQVIFTVGHSTRAIDEFIGLLQQHGVTRLADVRKIPESRHNPQFGREKLPKSLARAGIGYTHLPELGGLQHRPSLIPSIQAGAIAPFADTPITCRRPSSSGVLQN